ncbi:glutathione S-transferase family protein [uncultured Sneathiella sp.]|jgi:glutathione S-transferase|uniref:glutathione S-transferase family protein n=1 Tax=uncultured Sneathiella sp. TaxID=879315 RepID=UPI0030DB8338|tara:strand:+ start:11826 stop:12461 length:636 start_codon:yes stop_codon:yes gene_type:complete
MTIELFNFKFSAYGRIVKIVLAEKKIKHVIRDINPFDMDAADDYLQIHPFKRVPAIRHGDLFLYETSAITQYLDEAFGGPSLQPTSIQERARMRQVMAIVDNYGYRPLVRKVFSESVFNPVFDQPVDKELLKEGIEESAFVLRALEKIISDNGYIASSTFSLADAHLIPMVDYFTMAQEGIEMLGDYSKLSAWYEHIKGRPSVETTRSLLK